VTGGPLAGCRILVTRPQSQAAPLCRAIRDAGGEPILFPVLRIVPVSDAEAAAAADALPEPDLAVFVSRNAVEFGLRLLGETDARLAAVGPATAAALEARGAHANVVPQGGADSEHLLAEPLLADVAGRNVVIVRGENGRELLADTLRSRGATVHYLPVYRRERDQRSAEEVAAVAGALERGDIEFVITLSVETFRYLVSLLPAPAGDLLRQSTLVAPGERVIQGASELVPGLATCAAAGPGAGDIVNAMIDCRHSG
jgi:uroporphyrinogen-III synthase